MGVLFTCKISLIGKGIIFFSVFLFAPGIWVTGQGLSGYVRDLHSLETLPGTTIRSSDGKVLGFSDHLGFFSLPSIGDNSFSFSMVGFIQKDTVLTGKGTHTILLTKADYYLEEIKVRGTGKDDFFNNVIKLSVNDIRSYPSLMGEKDLVKVVQTLPGVKRIVEGGSGFSVRGGGPDQNLVLLDGVPLYSYNHLFGLFSMFNTDAVKDVQFSRDALSAQYGGRASSVLSISLKDGNRRKWEGDAGIGLISSKLTLNGPLIRDKLTTMVSIRRSYLDLLLTPLMSKSDRQGYHLMDVATKVNWLLSPSAQVTAGAYSSDDVYKERYERVSQDKSIYRSPVDLGWRNRVGYLRYAYAKNTFSFNTSAYISQYRFFNEESNLRELNQATTLLSRLDYRSTIRDIGINLKGQKYFGKTTLLFGGGVLSRTIQPQTVVQESEFNTADSRIQTKHNQEAHLFTEIEHRPTDELTLNLGLRPVLWMDKNTEVRLEPRVSATYSFPKIAFRLAYFRANQFVHLLSATGGALPNDVWMTANQHARPVVSDQVSVSGMKSLVFKQHSFHMELSVYYKRMKGVTEYANGQTVFSMLDATTEDPENLSDIMVSGKGESKGIELLIRHRSPKFNMGLSYTLSRTFYYFDGINNGDRYYPGFDRLHDFNITGSYTPGRKFALSAAFLMASASPVTLPAGIFHGLDFGFNSEYITTNEQALVNYRNNYRIEPYYRFDVSVSFHKTKKRVKRAWEISVFNASARRNPFYYYINRELVSIKDRQVRYSPAGKYFIRMIPSVSYILTF